MPSGAIGLPPGGTVHAHPEYTGPLALRYPDVRIGVKIRLTGAGLGGPCAIGGDVSIRSATHVDNAFPAPAARGCTRHGRDVDAVINAAANLPSPAGANTVILEEYFGLTPYNRLP
ncbi:hypothetical protein OHR68_04600 [Spirillospora sp. NBC_00431]